MNEPRFQRRDWESNPGHPKVHSLAGCCITALPPLQEADDKSSQIFKRQKLFSSLVIVFFN